MANQSFNQKLIDSYFLKQKLPHAFLFKANPKVNIDSDVLYLINKLNNLNLTSLTDNLPYDLVVLDSNKTTVDKEILEKAVYQMSSSPLVSKNKILVVKNLENIHQNSLNALLKFIEEPFFNTYIILTTNLIDKVLLTIKSRCQIFSVQHQKLENSASLKEQQFLLLESLVDSQQDFDKNIVNFQGYLSKINEQLKLALKNPYALKTFFDQELKKENSFFLLNIFRKILTLVLANDYQKDLFFDKPIFEKYLQSDIKIISLLELINQFLKQLNTNVNYFLLKEDFLIKMVGAYEK